ncbi:MAG: DUF748 domain-containing protein [Nitrosospira sp.]|nr:DUF748 domain-containing protein [Nitrosospira sp.]
MKRIIRRVAASKITWITALLLLLYTLGGFLLAPYLVERHLPRYLEEHLGHQARIDSVRMNPYLFTVDFSGFQLDGTDRRKILHLKRVYIDFELSSIFQRAWTLADLRVEGFDLTLEIDPEGRLNIMDIIERLKDPEQKDEPPPSLVLEHVIVSDSRVHVNDLSGSTPVSTAFGPINLELKDFSTIPDREGHYALAARLPAGGSVAWSGSVAVYPMASSGGFSIVGMKLATAWDFLRDELRIAEPGGELSLAGRYDFSHQQGETLLTVADLRAEISDLSLASAGGRGALLALGAIRLSGGRFALAEREIVVPHLELSNGTLSASLASDGTLDWLELAGNTDTTQGSDDRTEGGNAADAANAGEGGREEQPWKVRMENIAIKKVAAGYTDHTMSPALVFGAEEIGSSFSLEIAGGAGAPRIVAEDIQLAVNKAAVAPIEVEDTTPLATLDAVRVTGGRLDTHVRVARAGTLTLSGGDIVILRDADGPAGLLQLLPAANSTGEEKPGRDSNGEEGTADTPWKYQTGLLELKEFDIHLIDRSFKPSILYDIVLVSAAFRNIDSASESPLDFAAEFRIGGQGMVKASGKLQQDFSEARGKLEATGIPLEPLHPLVSRHAAVDLASGSVSVSAELEYRSGIVPEITSQGSASIHDFRVNEAGANERLIAWKTLSAQKISLSLPRKQLAIEEVHLHEPDMKLVIDEDRNVNLNQVIKKHNGDEAKTKQRSPEKNRSEVGVPFSVEVSQVRIAGGSLDFADLSLVLPFSTRVQALEGSIAGISSQPGSRAETELSGQVEEYGTARAAGALIPSDPKKFLDIRADFENIGLPALSPYSATFAGRKIAAGDLWLELHYKVVDGNLVGQNSITLADFKLGERVEAPTALDLPLDLAIALLRSPDGRIRLAVPIEGDLGNPRFDYGVLIRTALANVIQRIVTSPFRLLSGLLGGRTNEELQAVEFEAGSALLSPPQREKLHDLAEAMKQRPEVRLMVGGAFDPLRDGERLRSAQARRDLAAARGIRLEPGEDPGLIAYGDADTQKALEKLLIEQAGKKAVGEFAEEYARQTGREPDRVNPLLGLFGRGSEDRAFYAALFERLAELQPLPENALASLAESRAQAVIDAVMEAGIDRKHVESAGIKSVTGESGDSVAAELSLGAAPDDQ